MASKTIMIQERVYEKLAEMKQANESFSDVIQRLIYKNQDLTPFFGMLAGDDGESIEKAIEEARLENDQADLERGNGI